jgi:hypothetical protein
MINHPMSRTLHTDSNLLYQEGVEDYTSDLFFLGTTYESWSIIKLVRYSNVSPHFTFIGQLDLDSSNMPDGVYLKIFTPIAGTSAIAFSSAEKQENCDFYNFGLIMTERSENLASTITLVHSF